MDYKDQLKTEQWKLKAASIVLRDNNTCQHCYSKSRLEVHHKYYLKTRKAWEYPDDALITLCHKCHEVEETNIRNEKETIVQLLRVRKYMHHDIKNLFNAICNAADNGKSPNDIIELLKTGNG